MAHHRHVKWRSFGEVLDAFARLNPILGNTIWGDQVGNCGVGQSLLYTEHTANHKKKKKNGSKLGRETDNFLYQ